MILNTQQYEAEIEKTKPKMFKHNREQKQREKGKKWIKIDHKTWILQK